MDSRRRFMGVCKFVLTLLAVIFSTGMGALTWAQGDLPETCDPGAAVTDNTCTHVTDACIGGYVTHGCQSTNFVALCTQTYYLYVETYCTGGGDCKNCLGEAWVTDGSGSSLACNHTNCGPGGSCVSSQLVPVNLVRGQTYTLYACKLDCDDYEISCDSCPNTCTARSKIVE